VRLWRELLGAQGARAPPTEVIMTDTDDFMARYTEQARLRALLAPGVDSHNKRVLFDALRDAGIACVSVEFDGYGDSGQIESIAFLRPDNGECDGPATEVEIRSARYDGSGIDAETCTVAQAIETIAYRLLADSHGGWENNEGADGTFTFIVEHRTISLVYNEHYAATEAFEHEF